MSARSPTEVYLCLSRPIVSNAGFGGLIKFTDLSVNSNIQWFIGRGGSIWS